MMRIQLARFYWLTLGLIVGLSLMAYTSVAAQETIAWSPDGSRLARVAGQGVIVYDMIAGLPQIRWQVETGEYVSTVRFSPDGKWLAGGLGSGWELDAWLVIWEAQTGTEIARFKANRFVITEIAFSPNGSQVATGGGYSPTRMCGDYDVSVWDTTTWERITRDLHGLGSMTTIAYSPDGRYLAFSNSNSSTQIFDAATYTPLGAIHQEGARDIIFNADSTQVTAFFSGSVQVWDVRTEPEFHLVRSAIWQTNCTEFPSCYSPEDYVIGAHPAFFAAMINNGLEVHDVATKQTLFRYESTERHFSHAVFSPNGAWLAVFSHAAYTRDVEDYEPTGTL